MCLNKQRCTFFLVYLDLHLGVSPEETAHLVQSSVLLLLVDLHEDVLQALNLLSVHSFDLELKTFKFYKFGWLDG